MRAHRQKSLVFLATIAALSAQMVNAETAETEPAVATGDPVIAIAGDIACDPADVDFNGGIGQNGRCQQRATSDVLVSRQFDAVLVAGDIQYVDATRPKFAASYDPAWGRVKAMTRPVPGNHEYLNPNAAGYFEYFGAAAGDPAKGYYSFDIGAWHVIALNSNCENVGGCSAGSPQERWLAADLAANSERCTLAYWHHPRFSSGAGSDPRTDAFWRALYAGGADLVADGHDHIYERFAPQTPDGAADPSRGIREFTVGTGGKDLQGLNAAQPNSEVRNNSSFGVLQLTLRPTGYDFSFLPAAGSTFSDSGSGQCHYVSDAPAAVTATAGDGTATVTWSPPPDVGAPGLTTYTVTASPGGATVITDAGTRTATFSGLTNGTAYTFTAVANNVVGASAPSQPSSAVTPHAAPRPPEAPTGVEARPLNASATVSWSAPQNNGSPITKYTVTSSPDGATAVTSSTSTTVSGLRNGTSYTFTVTATNAAGTSPPSAASSAVTPRPGNRK